jgi:hypothetical protein
MRIAGPPDYALSFLMILIYSYPVLSQVTNPRGDGLFLLAFGKVKYYLEL